MEAVSKLSGPTLPPATCLVWVGYALGRRVQAQLGLRHRGRLSCTVGGGGTACPSAPLLVCMLPGTRKRQPGGVPHSPALAPHAPRTARCRPLLAPEGRQVPTSGRRIAVKCMRGDAQACSRALSPAGGPTRPRGEATPRTLDRGLAPTLATPGRAAPLRTQELQQTARKRSNQSSWLESGGLLRAVPHRPVIPAAAAAAAATRTTGWIVAGRKG